MTMAMAKARPRVSGLRREGHRPRARVPAPPSSCDNRRPVRAVIAICLLTLAGCSIDMPPADFAACGPTEPLPDAGTATPDYWHDAKPIIDNKCASCHVDGGIAPIAARQLRVARDWAGLIRNAITRKLMPPWPPNDCCESYQHDRSLSAVELDTLVRWIDAGTPEGDPVGAPPSRAAAAAAPVARRRHAAHAGGLHAGRAGRDQRAALLRRRGLAVRRGDVRDRRRRAARQPRDRPPRHRADHRRGGGSGAEGARRRGRPPGLRLPQPAAASCT